MYQVRNLSLWVKTGHGSMGVSSEHQQSAGGKLWSPKITQHGGSSLSCTNVFVCLFVENKNIELMRPSEDNTWAYDAYVLKKIM